MLGLLIALIVVVAMVSAIFHVSAGVAWVVVILAIVGAVIYQAKYGKTRRRTKTGLVFSSICPECRKRVKSNATRCHHCGVSLVERIQ